MGTHILAIKDMAGLCKPYAAYALVKALRDEVDVPIHFHTHDTSGINAGSHPARQRRRRGYRRRRPRLDERHDQPAESQFPRRRACRTRRATPGSIWTSLNRLSDYWEAVREQYYPFEEGMKAGTAEVYHHEMPGGQYTNLRQQAKSLGLEDRWHEIADTYAQVNKIFGDIVKVTPSSKVVGDMALFMVTNGLTRHGRARPARKKLNFPKSVVEMMQGAIGFPEGGWPKVLQKIILDSAGAKPIKGRPGAKLPKADFAATRERTRAAKPAGESAMWMCCPT